MSAGYQICVNAVGRLPDSTDYPYTVEDAADVASAVRDELDAYAAAMPYASFDPRTVPARLAETGGYLAVPLDWTYTLTVEPAPVQAGDMLAADGLGA